MEKNNYDLTIVTLFFLLPTLMLLGGYFFYPCHSSPANHPIIYLPLFLGLMILCAGFLLHNKNNGSKFKIFGWILFSSFWAMLPCFLYVSEGGDIFNAVVCILGVYVLMYLAYHEWLSIQKHQHPSCLNWIAGGTFLAGIIYFIIDSGLFPSIKNGLIELVAAQSAGLLSIFGIETLRNGSIIIYNSTPISIIFACTAIQAMVLFIGMIGALGDIRLSRRITGILFTVVPIYFLNLVRNASVIYLVGANITSFNVAHNYLAKLGALLTLIAILFLLFKILPELYDEITCLFDLIKRKGSVEQLVVKIVGKKKK
jgi:archaeosortase A (PGF-CTERM-specific)